MIPIRYLSQKKCTNSNMVGDEDSCVPHDRTWRGTRAHTRGGVGGRGRGTRPRALKWRLRRLREPNPDLRGQFYSKKRTLFQLKMATVGLTEPCIDLGGLFRVEGPLVGMRRHFVRLKGPSFGLRSSCVGMKGPCVVLRESSKGLRSKWTPFRPNGTICRRGRDRTALRGTLVDLSGP